MQGASSEHPHISHTSPAAAAASAHGLAVPMCAQFSQPGHGLVPSPHEAGQTVGALPSHVSQATTPLPLQVASIRYSARAQQRAATSAAK